jgi:UDP-3-O-[3-hydroxymyristoyl] glucosamine N-acyltransferase
MKLREIAEKIGGALDGDGNLEMSGVASIGEATPSEISFVANPKYAPSAAATSAGAVIVSNDWNAACSAPLIRVENPDEAFAKTAMLFYQPPAPPEPGIHSTAVVAEDVKLGEGVSIGPMSVVCSGAEIGDHTIISAQCYVGSRCSIGKDTLLHPQVSVRECCVLGDRVIVHNGTVVGSDGFGYSVDQQGVRTKIPQIGIVEVGNDAEIGANVTIDRARFGKTRIGNGVKIDNLVQIAHNVNIGDHSVIIAQVAIAGSTTLEDRVIMAGQSAVAGHLRIGAGAVVGAKAGVTKDVSPGEYVMGLPAMSAAKYKRRMVMSAMLPKFKERLVELEKKVAKLSQT